MTRTERWTIGIAIAALLVSLLSAVSSCGMWLYPRPAPPPQKEKARLEVIDPLTEVYANAPVVTLAAYADEKRHRVPYGDKQPTPVEFRAKGDSVAVRQVEFIRKNTIVTPDRENLYSATVTVPINFTKQHDVGKSRFVRKLKPPVDAEVDTYAVLDVAVVDPELAGRTYIGTVIVTYNNNEKVTVDNVELDILKEVPTPRQIEK